MNPRPITRAVNGAAGAPLSSAQKRDIMMLARRVWGQIGKPGFADQRADLPAEIRLGEAEAFELWRRSEQRAATGCAHLTAATNGMFPHYMRRFNEVLAVYLEGGTPLPPELDGGNGVPPSKGSGEARREEAYWFSRTIGDQTRVALWKLRQECQAAQDVIDNPRGYVAAISKNRFKTPAIETLSERQLWSLIFDLRRNAQRRRRKAVAVPF